MADNEQEHSDDETSVEVTTVEIPATITEATTAAADALTQVKQMEVSALAETINLLNGLVTKMQEALSKTQQVLEEAENLRSEAVELVEALNLQPNAETDSEGNVTQEKQDEKSLSQKFKEGLRHTLVGKH